ncbi:kelch domain-containing protein 3-like [Leguminivora glycinivorella]|uniref:kelch domain-containing protein 3-like n=1 Tax=Leguminivora glycinivorella TaxID=1035111 RepID=UPI00200C054E|nr:kelch domain-containing protein 3-like [Leguminivora glycinivorella]
MKWTAHIEGGPRRVNHAAVCIGEKILSFGGYCSTEEYKDWDPIPVHVLNTQTLRWSAVNYKKTDVVPFQRYGHTTVAYGEKVFMWGGRNNALACDILTVFDTRTLEWSTPTVSGMIPFAKDGHSACIINNKMYIFGGFEYLTDQYSQEVHCLNLDTFKWQLVEAKGTPPSHRDFHTAVAHGDRMYVFGGRGDLNSPYNSQEEIYCSHIYYLDTTTDTWVSLNNRNQKNWPCGRRSHSAWIHDDHMYIFGGYNGNTKMHFNDLFRYSIKNNYWELVHVNGQVPCKRRRQACLILKDKMYLFGGTSPQPAKNVPLRPVSEDDSLELLLDNNDLHILDYSPTLKTLCILKVLEYNLDQSVLPRHIIMDIRSMSQPNRISRSINQAG